MTAVVSLLGRSSISVSVLVWSAEIDFGKPGRPKARRALAPLSAYTAGVAVAPSTNTGSVGQKVLLRSI
jgi:acyl-CoA hydrolase